MNRLKLAKYAAIGKVTVRNQFAYIFDALLRSLFLLVILYILIQLWKVTYGGMGTERIAGYTFGQMIWYLIVSESIIMASPRVTTTVEEEVKTGAIAYLMTRPFSYIGYQYATYMGEASVKLLINLTLGSLLGLALIGPPDLGWGSLAFWPVAALAYTVNFIIRMCLALAAFWVEETQGLTLVYDKLLFTIGGMLLPLELFPEALRRICEWLPFQTIVYFPAKTAVRFDAGALQHMIGVQLVWGAVLAALLAFIYRKGAKRLNVNGG
ncbi:ABC transporter permease [Paenibacillus contaminans]|uniref:ABC transporter permease n=1 Tax=Paenibacillus contaminans TaxID=450362 RepID=A0A329MKK6_9BACL|nr:ABC-2 family transporter protein [Paenibacillus contaminans]RAV20461.1 ABC transporter permease [Paenibacillus contaminans]